MVKFYDRLKMKMLFVFITSRFLFQDHGHNNDRQIRKTNNIFVFNLS